MGEYGILIVICIKRHEFQTVHVSSTAKTEILQQLRNGPLPYNVSPNIWRPLSGKLWWQCVQVAIYHRQYLTLGSASCHIHRTHREIMALRVFLVCTCLSDKKYCDKISEAVRIVIMFTKTHSFVLTNVWHIIPFPTISVVIGLNFQTQVLNRCNTKNSAWL